MIIIALISLASVVLGGAIDLMGVVGYGNLSLSMINILGNILKYGNWLVGADLMLVFVGCVVFWWAIRLSFGILIWVWRMLPLT